jgi:hypothetical protein
MTLTNLNGRGYMRIPLTVGDIYGRSGLPDSDDLSYGGPVQTAELTVQCRDGQVILLGGRLDNGRAQVPLNRLLLDRASRRQSSRALPNRSERPLWADVRDEWIINWSVTSRC